jgi:hypothetical protein
METRPFLLCESFGTQQRSSGAVSIDAERAQPVPDEVRWLIPGRR